VNTHVETQTDAREGGVNPPLPRNCMRAFERLVERQLAGLSEHAEPDRHWTFSGKAVPIGRASQETGPIAILHRFLEQSGEPTRTTLSSAAWGTWFRCLQQQPQTG
jgi:hypothetical protein